MSEVTPAAHSERNESGATAPNGSPAPRARLHPLAPPITRAVINARVLTMDARFTEVPDGAVLISGPRVAAVRPMRDPRVAQAIAAGAEVIDARGGLVLPGLINTHTHLGMTLFRGMADDRDLQAFLDAVWPLEREFVAADTVRLGVGLGIAESLRAGVTTAADMYFHPAVAAAEAERIGFRLLTGPTLADGIGVEFADFDASFAAAREWLAEREPGLGLRMSLCPHSTYLLDDRQLRRIAALGAEFDALVQVHAAENGPEIAAVAARHGGKTPIETLKVTGLLDGHILLAHAVELSETDIELIAARGERTRGIAHCPASNMKLASGAAPIPALRARGIPVGLGTDGPASSNDLDLLAATRIAGLLHALTSGPGALGARDLVAMATIDGARALGIDPWVGSLEPHKLADLVILDGASPLALGADPYSALVYALGRAEVRTVLVDGQVRVADGRPVGIDVPELRDELAALISRYPR